MVIKCDQQARFHSIAWIIFHLIFSIQIGNFTNSIEGSVLGFIFLSPIMFNTISMYEKTLIMDSQGCTIKFLCFSRSYKWSELKTKEYRYFKDGHAYRDTFESGAIFCKRRVRMPKWTKPSVFALYFQAFRWFSFSYVYFSNNKPKRIPELYVVNEAEFRAKMEEWGVDMNDKTEDDKKYFPYG